MLNVRQGCEIPMGSLRKYVVLDLWEGANWFSVLPDDVMPPILRPSNRNFSIPPFDHARVLLGLAACPPQRKHRRKARRSIRNYVLCRIRQCPRERPWTASATELPTCLARVGFPALAEGGREDFRVVGRCGIFGVGTAQNLSNG